MGTRLYVGNLSYGVTNESLEQLFAQFGPVKSAQVITDRDTGRSKGFGFVEMGDDNSAQKAILVFLGLTALSADLAAQEGIVYRRCSSRCGGRFRGLRGT